jgi:hypothetical protein
MYQRMGVPADGAGSRATASGVGVINSFETASR